MSNTANKLKLTKAHARKVLAVVEKGLVKGLGVAEPGKMCVEAAVCFALGLPHSDTPPCVSPVVRSFKIALNDLDWPTDADRADGMKRIAIAQLGSDGIDEQVFAKELSRLTIQRIVPIALRAAVSMHADKAHKAALETAAKRCEDEGTDEAASAASYAASDAASAASYAARYAASAASYAASAASYAARYAASAARYAASAAKKTEAATESAKRKARLKVYRILADIGVEALKVAGSIGCKWLDIVQ